MRRLENNEEGIAKAVEVLKEGGVITHPADTCYGLAADLMNEKAVKKLQAIKGRDAGKPMSIMLPAFLKPQLADYGICDSDSGAVCDKLFPGPVTIVLPKGPKIPDYFFPELDTVGIRMPYDVLTEELLRKFKGPLVTTSANLSSQSVCCKSEEVAGIFEGRDETPELMLEGEISGKCMPSAVLKMEKDGLRLLRQGPRSVKELEAMLGMEIIL